MIGICVINQPTKFSQFSIMESEDVYINKDDLYDAIYAFLDSNDNIIYCIMYGEEYECNECHVESFEIVDFIEDEEYNEISNNCFKVIFDLSNDDIKLKDDEYIIVKANYEIDGGLFNIYCYIDSIPIYLLNTIYTEYLEDENR